eukprot:CAMPEP_0168738380 /NCGR_PEP_ID=MMETSP0724-20121128/10900_1 /TAXON_ID=265536 /ORGANISM="Amphiprora sp., Strain CCMP467" /LENGTH=437 /DNA_ID=CAMNT_0008785715 /DNA_START=74 /DNA_END=1388 /DNA_ORIENTATION=-
MMRSRLQLRPAKAKSAYRQELEAIAMAMANDDDNDDNSFWGDQFNHDSQDAAMEDDDDSIENEIPDETKAKAANTDSDKGEGTNSIEDQDPNSFIYRGGDPESIPHGIQKFTLQSGFDILKYTSQYRQMLDHCHHFIFADPTATDFWSLGNESAVKILDLSKATGITGEARHGFRLSCPTVETLVLPQRLKKIPYTAFLGCGSLCSVTIPAATTSIGECAFEDTNLTTVVFEAAQSFSVITGKYAKVVDDVLLENVSDTDIELHDFRGSNDLEMWEWREYKGFRGPFNGCDNLSKIEVPFASISFLVSVRTTGAATGCWDNTGVCSVMKWADISPLARIESLASTTLFGPACLTYWPMQTLRDCHQEAAMANTQRVLAACSNPGEKRERTKKFLANVLFQSNGLSDEEKHKILEDLGFGCGDEAMAGQKQKRLRLGH